MKGNVWDASGTSLSAWSDCIGNSNRNFLNLVNERNMKIKPHFTVAGNIQKLAFHYNAHHMTMTVTSLKV